MPLFKFKISDPNGAVSETLVEGDSQNDAARRLQNRGLTPLTFLGEGSQNAPGHRLGKGKFSATEFTERLVPLIAANIPLERALNIIAEDKDNCAIANLASELRKGLHEGRKFSDLIRERSGLFPPLYSGVVEAGEEAGALPQVMQELQKFLTDAAELKSFIISASIYPAFILGAGLCMLTFILGIIIPKFASTLAATGIKSTATDLLTGCASAFRTCWWIIPLLIIALVTLIRRIRTPDSAANRFWDRTVLKFPFLGRLVLISNLGRLARTMAILMRSGVHLLSTVSIANRVIQNHTIRTSIQDLSGDLRQGQRLSASLGHSPYVPSMMLEMITVGEETGQVDAMLDRVADHYESELKKGVRRLLNLFEPIIIVLLGIGVGCVVLLMFMAIMDMQNVAN